jgi:hypothetical protein
MRTFALMLLPAALFAGQVRFARLGDFDGNVEIQMQAADPWMQAERNLPLVEGAWLRTGPASRLEIELDDGSAWRLGPDSQGEISDYSRLSTGQLITLLSLDHGVAYFTGEARGKDSLSLAIPGAQLILTNGARIRLRAESSWSEMAVIEGSVKVSSPDVEVVLGEGQTIRVDSASDARLVFIHKVEAMDPDQWSEARDKALYAPASANHVPERAGVADLDSAGEWVHTDDLGDAWKPKTAAGWAPFQNGRWRWYDATGYTWVGGDSWGWLPYHYGRWARRENVGWVWAPGDSQVFKPGEVYWLRGAKLAGWGPLAPGEEWAPSSAPRQFAAASTTYASWVQDATAIDPAGFTDRPREPLGVAVFALALPSPALVASRLDATRPVLRAGSTAVNPVLPGVTPAARLGRQPAARGADEPGRRGSAIGCYGLARGGSASDAAGATGGAICGAGVHGHCRDESAGVPGQRTAQTATESDADGNARGARYGSGARHAIACAASAAFGSAHASTGPGAGAKRPVVGSQTIADDEKRSSAPRGVFSIDIAARRVIICYYSPD